MRARRLFGIIAVSVLAVLWMTPPAGSAAQESDGMAGGSPDPSTTPAPPDDPVGQECLGSLCSQQPVEATPPVLRLDPDAAGDVEIRVTG